MANFSNQKDSETLRRLVKSVNKGNEKTAIKTAAKKDAPAETPAPQDPPTETPTPQDPPTETPTPQDPPTETPTPQDPPAETPAATEAPAATTEQKGLSLFSDLNAPTQQDKAEKDKVETIAEELAQLEAPPETPEADPQSQKELNAVLAGIYVELADVVFMVICLFLEGDFSEGNQKKYSLIPDRKKAIKANIFRLLQARKKASKPGPALIGLILGSYAPMLVLATIRFIKRKKEKNDLEEQAQQQAKQAATAQAQAEQNNFNQRQATAQQVFDENNGIKTPPQPPAPPAPPKAPTNKKAAAKASITGVAGKQGRHKLWCAKNKGLTCNCKK